MKKSIFVIICLFSNISFLCAQEVLTKDKAIQNTLESNFDILISNNALEQAENSKSILNSGYLPTIESSGSGTYGEFRGASGTQSNIQVGLSYVLFNGFNRNNVYKRLKEAYSISEVQAREVLENTIVNLFTAYYEVARLEENEKTQSQALLISKERLKRAIYGFEYGQQTKLDILNAEVDMNNDSINYLEIKRQLANAKRDLNVIMGVEVGTDVLVDTSVVYNQGLTLDSIRNSAMQNNAALIQANKSIKLGQYDVKVNRSTWLPTIGVSSAYRYTQSDFLPVFGGLNASVNFSWNIFDGGRTSTNVQNAKVAVNTAEIRKEQLQEQLQRDVRNAWETYQNLLYTYQVQKINQQTNIRNFRRTDEGFRLGQISSIDFRLAQVNLLNATLALSQAKYNAKNAELRLLQLSGLLVDNQKY